MGIDNREVPYDNTMFDRGDFNHFIRRGYTGVKPRGIVIHEVANDTSSLQQELNYQQRRTDGIFVHAYAGPDAVSQTHDYDLIAQGAGKYANPYYVQIEIVRGNVKDRTPEDFNKTIANTAKWSASIIKQFDLGEVTLADDNNGVGTIISHAGVAFVGLKVVKDND